MKENDLNVHNKKIADLDIQLEIFLSIIWRNHFVFLNRETKKLNIKGTHAPCLMVISEHPGITQEDIANIFQIDKGFIARIVRELEENELLYRTVDPDNRRKYNIFLTENGENIIPKLKNINKKWEKLVCEGLNEDESFKLIEFMDLLAQNSLEKIKNQS